MRHFEAIDEKQSILSCCNHNCGYILNSDGVTIIALANHIRNFCCERHVHLCSLLHGMNSMYKLIVDNNKMDIVMVIVENDANKPRIASMCLNWKLTRQRSLGKESSAKHMIEHHGALQPQKKPPKLAFNKYNQ